jgi:hypothetical protein
MAEAPKRNYDKTIVIHVQKSMWQALRKVSYEKEISMTQLIRWSIEKIINKHTKDVDE